MRKKTAQQNPGNRKASPKQTKGLVAKGQKPRRSAQEECALDNRSHRTSRGLPAFAKGATFAPANGVTPANDPKGRERQRVSGGPAVKRQANCPWGPLHWLPSSNS